MKRPSSFENQTGGNLVVLYPSQVIMEVYTKQRKDNAIQRIIMKERRKEDKEVMKEAWKEAMKEWLDDKYATLGRWSVRVFAAVLLGSIVIFVLNMSGWHK